MGRHVGPSNTTHLIRASQKRGPWLMMSAASTAKFYAACRALGAPVTRKMKKHELRNELLKFPKEDVKRALGWQEPKELTDAEREDMCRRLRLNGFM